MSEDQKIEVISKGLVVTCKNCFSLLRIPRTYDFPGHNFRDTCDTWYYTEYFECPVCSDEQDLFEVTQTDKSKRRKLVNHDDDEIEVDLIYPFLCFFCI